MNRRMIGRTVGKITLLEAVLLVLPMLVCAIYREWLLLFAFFAAAASAAIIGVLLTVISKPRTTEIFVREGFITVALAWIVLSLIGALPFFISREIPSSPMLRQ